MKYFKKANAGLLTSWRIVAISGLAHGINSSGYNKGYVVFILPVIESLGVSRATISFIFALSRSEGGPIGPLAGWCYDRVESYSAPLWVFTGFFALAALCFALMRKPGMPIQEKPQYSLNANLNV